MLFITSESLTDSQEHSRETEDWCPLRIKHNIPHRSVQAICPWGGRKEDDLCMKVLEHMGDSAPCEKTWICKGKLGMVWEKPKEINAIRHCGYSDPQIYLFCFIKFENTNYISSAIIFKCIQDEPHASHIRLTDMHSSVIRDPPKNNVLHVKLEIK